MSLGHFTYLAVDMFILVPFLAEMNDRRLGLREHRKSIALSTALVLTVFAVWDVFAVRGNVWGFNPEYVTGLRIAGLPIEELIFFVSVPVTSILVWEATEKRRGRK